MTHPTDALRLVPVEPTPKMIDAGAKVIREYEDLPQMTDRSSARDFIARNWVGTIWPAMLAAAPDMMCCDNCGTIRGKADECDCSRHDGTPPVWVSAAPASPLPEGGGDMDWQSIAMWMGFSASVIKSGEPWSDQCQQHYDEAKAAFARLAAPTGDRP